MSTIYKTGIAPDGKPLIGGVWKLWHQDGFPVELSYLQSKLSGFHIDWMEAMADASSTDNLPSLAGAVEDFLAIEELSEIKLRFSALIRAGITPVQILEQKQKHKATT